MNELPVLEYMRHLKDVQWVQFFLLMGAIYLAPHVSPRVGRWITNAFFGAALYHFIHNVKGVI